MALYPDYSRHQADNTGAYEYEFGYRLKFGCRLDMLSNLSVPEHAEVLEATSDKPMCEIYGCTKSRNINFYWRSRDMMKPHLLYARDKKTSEVACVASLVPTFEPPMPQEDIEVLRDEEPEMTMLAPGSDYHFIFLIDRSSSMR